jgi:hypothetical protein
VRNGSLRAGDFGAGQLPAGQQGQPGARGAAGPRGAAGAAGPKGESGPTGRNGTSNGATNVFRGDVRIGTTSSTQIISLNLTPGAWIINAAGQLDNDMTDQGHRVGCELQVDGERVADLGIVRLAAQPEPGEQLPFALTGAGSVDARTTATVRCLVQESGNFDVEVVNPSITAIQVDKLSGATR